MSGMQEIRRREDADEVGEVKAVEQSALRETGSELMIRRMQDLAPIGPYLRKANRLIEYDIGDRRVVEAFRNLRTLLLQQAGQGNFITLVTSVKPDSGTSFVARNLAAAFAFDPTKTSLLVDCNRVNPSLDRLLQVDDCLGLTDLLENPREVNIEQVIHSTGIPRLRAIPIGRSRFEPVEFFTTVRMHACMDILARRYPDRYIVLDSPAVQESADAQILADWCDYIVVVVRDGEVDKNDLLSTIAAFPKEKFVGVVYNDFDDTAKLVPDNRVLER